MSKLLKINNNPLSRYNYVIYQIVLFVIGFIVETLARIFFKKTLLENNPLNYFALPPNVSLGYILLKMLFSANVVIGIVFQARRLLDIGWSKYLSLLSLIPVIGIIVTGACLIKKGDLTKT